MRTKFESQKFKKFVEKKIIELEHLYKTNHLSNWKQQIIHVKQNLSDLKIQLARKIRTDILSLYRKTSSLGAPDISAKLRIHS